jgi:hypothetical protein
MGEEERAPDSANRRNRACMQRDDDDDDNIKRMSSTKPKSLKEENLFPKNPDDKNSRFFLLTT